MDRTFEDENKFANMSENQNLLLVPQVFFQNNMSLKKNISLNMDDASVLNHYIKASIKVVECRIEFVTVGEVDTFNEQFKAFVKVRSKWIENEVIDEYNPKTNWNPKLYIENAIPEKFYEDVSYKTVIKDDDKTEITEIRICKGTFWERYLKLKLEKKLIKMIN